MNIYTDKSQFTESPDYILENSNLLIPNDCTIHNGVLYERLTNEDSYRFFFNCDDYDYVEDNELEMELDGVFGSDD